MLQPQWVKYNGRLLPLAAISIQLVVFAHSGITFKASALDKDCLSTWEEGLLTPRSYRIRPVGKWMYNNFVLHVSQPPEDWNSASWRICSHPYWTTLLLFLKLTEWFNHKLHSTCWWKAGMTFLDKIMSAGYLPLLCNTSYKLRELIPWVGMGTPAKSSVLQSYKWRAGKEVVWGHFFIPPKQQITGLTLLNSVDWPWKKQWPAPVGQD